ncbi:MAG: Crp/Fnr family transcriptional regulator [Chloroflexota bacterium]|nr:Crp/Fnr family transcriptional regulator [Chloroflexota bacterium]
MKLNLHDIPTNQSHSFKSSTSANAAALGYNNLAQTLTTLREEDTTLNKIVRVQQVERGSLVATPDDLTRKMYVLMSGKVNMICTNNEGRRLVIASLEPGAIFGEGALDNPGDPNVFVEAAEPVAVWVIPASEARNLTIQYPILGWGLLQTYGERLFQVENSLENVAYKKLPERLATLLLELADEPTGTIKGISHQALADHLGTYRETVSAILRDFKRQGLVELGYRRIHLIDIEGLKDIGGVWEW